MLKYFLLIPILLFGLNFTSSAQSSDGKLVNFYPSPATTVINFDLQVDPSDHYKLQVFNFMGSKVYEAKDIPAHIEISLTDFYRGVYIFQLRDEEGHIIESGKFQVVK